MSPLLLLVLLQICGCILAQQDTNVVSDSWIQMTTPQNPPTAREFHTGVYNAINRTMVIFGGTDGKKKVYNDLSTYAVDINLWATAINTSTGAVPAARYGHSAVATGRNTMVVFGGRDLNSFFNDVAVFDMVGNQWLAVSISGNPPAPRAFHTASVDTYMHVMYVYGGSNDADYFSDLYALDLVTLTWTQISPANGSSVPVARAYHSAVINSIGVMIVFGGLGSASQGLDDVACFDTTTGLWWSCLAAHSPSGPGARYGHSAVISPLEQITIFGGRDKSGDATNDIWDLDLYQYKWSSISPGGLPLDPRAYHASIATAFGSMVVFGGQGADGSINNDFGLYNLASTVLRSADDGMVLVIILSLLGTILLSLCFAMDYMHEQGEIEKEEAIEKAKAEAVLLPKLPQIPKALHIPLGPRAQKFFDDFRSSLDPLKDPPQ